jgi:hypothetical protein
MHAPSSVVTLSGRTQVVCHGTAIISAWEPKKFTATTR